MEFVGQFAGDLGATVAAGNVVLGDRLGLYRGLAEGPATAADLAARTGTHARYVTEWLRGQAAGGYIEYDADTDSYSMTPEQAFALTDPQGVLYLPGAFELALGAIAAVPRMEQAFTTGAGLRLARARRPGVLRLREVLPARLPGPPGAGVDPGARRHPGEARGAARKVADIGCGHGASSILLAEAFPGSTIVGSDYHAGSIEEARNARGRGGGGRPGVLRGRRRAGVLRQRLLAGGELRLPARHGRPAGRGQARAQLAGTRRQLADRRAGRRRQRRGEPQPGGPGLLQLLDAAVRAQRDVAARRLRPRRAGRRAGDPPGRAPTPASPGSAGSRRRRSTWCTRHGSDGAAGGPRVPENDPRRSQAESA